MFGLGSLEILIIIASIAIIGGGIYLIFRVGKLSGENKVLKQRENDKDKNSKI